MSNETYGLLIRRTNRYGTEYLIAEVVKRNEEGKIRNCTNTFVSELPKHLQGFQLEGLALEGFISEFGEPRFLDHKPRFRDVHSVDLATANRMVKTLKKIEAQAVKFSAETADDWFEALCAALRLSFVVESRDKYESSNYDDRRWTWMTTYEGRNRYRHLIINMVEAAKEAKKESVA